MWKWLTTPETITETRLFWFVVMSIMLDDTIRSAIRVFG